jgi:EmrB/QacA subfamily drug resistance transporter
VIRRGTLAVVCVAQFVDVLGVTIAVIALPSLGRTFPAGHTELQWVVSGYALVFGGLLVAAGRAADRYGQRRTFLAGLAVLLAASMVGASAPTILVLITARAVQGLAAAFMVPSALALLLIAYPDDTERHRALGVWTAAGAVGGAAGFLAGGLLVEAAGWRSVFLVNVPICAAALIVAPLVLPADVPARTNEPADLLGAVLATVGLLGVLTGLTTVTGRPRLVVLLAAVLALAAFAIVERRTRNPLMPSRFVRSGRFVAALVIGCLLTCTTTPASVLGTIFLQDRLGYPAGATGLMFAPFSLAVVLGSWLSTRLGGRWGHRATALAGLLALITAMVVCTVAVLVGSSQVFVLGLVISGTGLGCVSVTVTTAGTAMLADSDKGIAGGLLNATPQIGSALGTAVATGVADMWTLVGGYLLAVGLAAVGVVATAALPGRVEIGVGAGSR